MTIFKLTRRSYMDLEFTLNNIIMNSSGTVPETADTIKSTL